MGVKNIAEIKTQKNGWMDAHRMKNYGKIYDSVCAVAGEGELVTAERVGKKNSDFAYSEIRMVVLNGNEILYSTDGSNVDVEFLGGWFK